MRVFALASAECTVCSSIVLLVCLLAGCGIASCLSGFICGFILYIVFGWCWHDPVVNGLVGYFGSTLVLVVVLD